VTIAFRASVKRAVMVLLEVVVLVLVLVVKSLRLPVAQRQHTSGLPRPARFNMFKFKLSCPPRPCCLQLPPPPCQTGTS
jgi:hypothetical protein